MVNANRSSNVSDTVPSVNAIRRTRSSSPVAPPMASRRHNISSASAVASKTTATPSVSSKIPSGESSASARNCTSSPGDRRPNTAWTSRPGTSAMTLIRPGRPGHTTSALRMVTDSGETSGGSSPVERSPSPSEAKRARWLTKAATSSRNAGWEEAGISSTAGPVSDQVTATPPGGALRSGGAPRPVSGSVPPTRTTGSRRGPW